GTNNSIGFSSSTMKSGDYEDEFSVFNFSPKLGCFITKNLVLGANIKFWVQKEDEYKTSITAVGPFARYYITDGKIVPFVEAEATFGNYKDTWESSYSDGESKEKLSIYSVGGGLAFIINKFISVDCLVGYKTISIKDSDSDDDDKMTLNNFGVVIGFTATF
ncbi:MAG: outer membrane beta-barrel protein, partial [Draconibacterium sp.]|nr:outer membrane beta-barrel protein [Draconibacterium sp.]